MHLSWIDYGIMIVLLVLSASIGIYHGCIRSKQLSANEFLIADGKMKILPTAMSLMASIMSAVTLLGVPVEVYSYGTMYLYWIVGWFIGTFFTTNLFIPMFRRLNNISIYAYFEQRFSLSVRIVITITFSFVNIIFMAVILYAPSLALSQVTGLHIWFSILSCGIICTLYTSIGGMKAVIWTDVAQTVMMFFGLVLSIIFGVMDIGGIRNVYDTAMDGNRIQFANIKLDFSIRYTVWSLVIGGSFYSIAVYSCVQTQAQRFLCVKTTQAAKRVGWANFIMFSVFNLLCALVGCILYAKYGKCDPLRARRISKPDQLYPLFISETLGRFPGLTGLFITGIMSASLSTISSGINSIATVLIEDIYKRIKSEQSMSDEKQAIVSKILSVAIGLIVLALAIVVSYLGTNIIVIVFQIAGSFAGPVLGVYLLGFFAPRVNSRSVLVAFSFCLAFQTWILAGANLTIKQYMHKSGRLPTSVDGCVPKINQTETVSLFPSSSNPLLPLYSMSVVWYSLSSAIVVVIVGLLVSFILGSNEPGTIDESLLVSWKEAFGFDTMRKEHSAKNRNNANMIDKQSVEQEQML